MVGFDEAKRRAGLDGGTAQAMPKGQLRAGVPEIQLHERRAVGPQFRQEAARLARQLAQNPHDLLALARPFFGQLVARPHGLERLDEQRLAAARRVVHDSRQFPACAGPHGHDAPTGALSPKAFLQDVAVAVLRENALEDPLDLAFQAADLPADRAQFVARRVADLALGVEDLGDARGQGAQWLDGLGLGPADGEALAQLVDGATQVGRLGEEARQALPVRRLQESRRRFELLQNVAAVVQTGDGQRPPRVEQPLHLVHRIGVVADSVQVGPRPGGQQFAARGGRLRQRGDVLQDGGELQAVEGALVHG